MQVSNGTEPGAQMRKGVSGLCWHDASVANVLLKPV